MKAWMKIVGGAAFWIASVYVFAYWAHIAPEGAYTNMASSLEIFSMLFGFAYLVGVPILIRLWIFYDLPTDTDQ